jgi:hypothetical protein
MTHMSFILESSTIANSNASNTLPFVLTKEDFVTFKLAVTGTVKELHITLKNG